MNFSKLPKEKRNQLVLVVLVTLIAVAGLYFGLIRRQNENLARLAEKKDRRPKAPGRARRHPPGRPDQSRVEEARKTLAEAESDIASGDLYAWVINSLRQFKAPYKVEIPQFSQLARPRTSTCSPISPTSRPR